MERDIAQRRAREYLSREIEIEFCDHPPGAAVYTFDPATEYLFRYRLPDGFSIGSRLYLAVNKESGEVRLLGRYGE